jgi:hypothetical protein
MIVFRSTKWDRHRNRHELTAAAPAAQAALIDGGTLELAVDLSFGTDPNDRGARSLAKQLGYSYSNVRAS